APDTPAELIRICDKAMAADPNARYQKAAELLDDLNAYLVAAGEVVSVRDVSAVVGEVFSTEHGQTRSAIDRCLGALKSGDAARQHLPSLPMVAHEGTPTDASPHAEASVDTRTPSTPNGTAAPDTEVSMIPAQRRAWAIPAAVAGLGAIALVWFAW